MNVIEINEKAIESFGYDEIKGFITFLEQNPEENKGTLVIRFPELEAEKGEPLFMNKVIKGWYMGLMYNTPNLLYFLSDKHEGRQWTDLQFAMMMFSDVKEKNNDGEYVTIEVKVHEEIFGTLIDKTAEYMVKISGNEKLTREEQEFFAHLFFDYTNGFHGM
ncbi:hypothetical protein CVD28_01615 [Bacillus sp. M6-12]|uniref:hypothetical protein n=1 Tax=Bacillus sp. M6-12 TaxID=2054166 RepID=UPI000C78A28A|nr:hypothetical protein [Bacillus sp. M6-12]PLS19131.1 hypothetical protein CVD28_01615 [Bacillus sp. M6-12]